MADPTNPLGDEVDLDRFGKVTVSLTGKHFRWRRPTFGEFTKFEELWAEVNEKERIAVENANETPEKDRTGAWRVHFESHVREVAIGWALDVWRVLCDKEPPTVDELPPWMTNGSFHALLKEHWTTVPLAASSR